MQHSLQVQHKRQRLQTLLDQVKQKEQETHVETKAAVDLLSSLNRLVIQLKQDISNRKRPAASPPHNTTI
jgi:hypothetical protein